MISSRRKITLLMLFALTLCGVCAAPSRGQQTSKSKIELPVVINYNGDMAYMLVELSELYKTTIGLEVDPQQPRSQVVFYLRDPALADVLNAIVQSAPRYQWRENGDFIEVGPKEGGSGLLATIIHKFKVVDVDDGEAIDRLLNLSEVQANARAISLSRPHETATEKKGDKFSLDLENVTMRQALNSIAQASGKRFWILRRDGNGSFSIGTSPR